MRAILLILFISAGAFAVQAGNLNQRDPIPQDSIKIRKLLSDIAKENVFEATTDVPALTKQMKRGALLSREAPFDLLKICMENENPVVRLYAFKALTEKMDNIPPETALKFKNDSTIVTVVTDRGRRQVPVSHIANGFLK